MTYRCPVCNVADENAYLACNHPGCTDGRDCEGRTPGTLYSAAAKEAFRQGERAHAAANRARIRAKLARRDRWIWFCLACAFVLLAAIVFRILK